MASGPISATTLDSNAVIETNTSAVVQTKEPALTVTSTETFRSEHLGKHFLFTLALNQDQSTAQTLGELVKDQEGVVNCATLTLAQLKVMLEQLCTDLSCLNQAVQKENSCRDPNWNLRKHQDGCAKTLGLVQHKLDEDKLSPVSIFQCIAILYEHDQHKMAFKSTYLQQGLTANDLGIEAIQAMQPRLQTAPPINTQAHSMASYVNAAVHDNAINDFSHLPARTPGIKPTS